VHLLATSNMIPTVFLFSLKLIFACHPRTSTTTTAKPFSPKQVG
jgi:hypothetical protein